jgi:LysM domain
MSALSAIEAEESDVVVPSAMETAARGSAAPPTVRPRTRLLLVSAPGHTLDRRSAARSADGSPVAGGQRSASGRPVADGQRSAGGRPVADGQRSAGGPQPAADPRHAAGIRPAACPLPARTVPARTVPLRPAPLRLTRRGRIVVGCVSVVLATVALTLGGMSLSGAQAANHGRPAAGYQGMRQIVVQPGQTLWSIATEAEPSADPRQVIAEIMTANSLAGSTLQAGQLLWVPR